MREAVARVKSHHACLDFGRIRILQQLFFKHLAYDG